MMRVSTAMTLCHHRLYDFRPGIRRWLVFGHTIKAGDIAAWRRLSRPTEIARSEDNPHSHVLQSFKEGAGA